MTTDVRRVLAALTFAFVAAGGCSDDDPCAFARQKFEICKGAIQKAGQHSGFMILPVEFSGECTGQIRCEAECTYDADCEEIALAVSGGVTDPNSPPVKTGFLECLGKCGAITKQ
jgi:hypothetical protein